MQWANSAYAEQSTSEARLAMARSFVTELTNAVTSRISGNGESVDPTTVLELLKIVKTDVADLQREVDASGGVGLPRMVSTVTRDLRGGY